MCHTNTEIQDIKIFLFEVISLYGESILRHPKDETDLQNFDNILMHINIPSKEYLDEMIRNKKYNIDEYSKLSKLCSVVNKIINQRNLKE
jgi:hypothetical protein